MSLLLMILMDLLGLRPAGPAVRQKTGGLQLAAIRLVLPVCAAVNFAAAVLFGWTFLLPSGLLAALAPAGWVLVLSAVFFRMSGTAWMRCRLNAGVLFNVLYAGLLAAGWCAAIWASLPLLVREDMALAALLVCAVAGCGSMVFGILPAAGAVWLLPFVAVLAQSALAYGQDEVPFLVLLLAAGTAAAVIWMFLLARIFGAHAAAILAAEQAAAAAGQMFRQFEELGSGWFWETGPGGVLTYCSPKLEEQFGLLPGGLSGFPLFSFLLDGAEMPAGQGDGNSGLNAIRAAYANRTAFRDCVAGIDLRGQRRWWRLSAVPGLDAAGRFAGWRGAGADVTAARERERDLSLVTNYDSLTGLANRNRFQAELDAAEVDLNRGERAAVIVFELDRSPELDEAFAPRAGDTVLFELASRLRPLVVAPDFAARTGADSFAVVLRGDATPERCAALADRISNVLSAPVMAGDRQVRSGVFAGMAFGPEHGRDAGVLLRHAALALKQARSSGVRTGTFVQAMEDEVHARVALIRDLQKAVERNELLLYYQPQINVMSQEVVGFEALIRWQHPRLGLLSPVAFIALAEDTGLIGPIGHWVIEQACKDAAAWPGHLRVAVNISALQLQSGELAGFLRDCLARYRLPARKLELEITESLLLEDIALTKRLLAAFKDIGTSVALDDFGTGYSSLSYIRTLTFDRLKIDRSFLANSSGGAGDPLSILAAIVAMARALKLETICEGIEEPSQMDILRRLGVTEAQGYWIARPMPLGQLPHFVKAWQARRQAAGQAEP